MLITDVYVAGRGRTHVLLRDGRIAGFPAERLAGEPELAGRGRQLVPGLVDAHLHLLASAAAARTIDARTLDETTLREHIRIRAATGAVRVTGYGGSEDSLFDRHALDRLCPAAPLRLQYRSGSLWVLNTAALDALPPGRLGNPAFERGADGRLNGRVWRGDALLRTGSPDAQALQRLGARLARWGVTALTDASATTDDAQAELLGPLLARLPQRVQLMGGAALSAPRAGAWTLGARKILLDEAALPPLDSLCAWIDAARAQGRPVAVHCVTPTELALAVAALQCCGAAAGDRIEHGSLIAPDMIPVLAELGLCVVTQPGFVQANGDRYRRDLPAGQHADLYRVRSLLAAGVPVAFSSDAPYGPLNPWANLRSAVQRRTASGARLHPGEAVEPALALALHGPSAFRPASRAGPAGALAVGDAADLCLLRDDVPWLESDDPVACTLVGGVPVYKRDSTGRGVVPASRPPEAASARENVTP